MIAATTNNAIVPIWKVHLRALSVNNLCHVGEPPIDTWASWPDQGPAVAPQAGSEVHCPNLESAAKGTVP
jgi:hypothetical protein